jgi:SAM-dependent methyltransferase
MPQVAPFEKYIVEYDAWFERHPDLYLAELAALRSVLPSRGRRVEIGVGTGRFAAPLGIPLGVEPSPRMAELARQRGIKVVEGLAEALPFQDGRFDIVVMVTVICFLDDVAQAFREAFRVLKDQGTLIIGFINGESELGERYSRRKAQDRFYGDATFYSAKEVEALLTDAGFSAFTYRQTLLPGNGKDLSVREGCDRGGFVVVRAQKTIV